MSYNKNMNSDEYYNFEDNNYINPTMSRDEQLSFVDNLRNIQDKRNTEIETQTHGLGTQIPSKKGGLNAFSTQLNTTGTGGPLLDENGVAKTNPDSFFNKRYQTTQLDSQVAALKSAAQASALNNILANEQAQWKKLYNDAYKAAQKRAAAAAAAGGGGNNYNLEGQVDENPVDNDPKAEETKSYISTAPGYTAIDMGGNTPDIRYTNNATGETVYQNDLVDNQGGGAAFNNAMNGIVSGIVGHVANGLSFVANPVATLSSNIISNLFK